MKKKSRDSKAASPSGKRPSVREAVRPTIEVTITRHMAGEAQEEHTFVLADGRMLRNLLELADAFQDMSEDVFRHHVNEFKNDFRSWVQDIFKEDALAEELKHVHNVVDAELAVLRHVVKKSR